MTFIALTEYKAHDVHLTHSTKVSLKTDYEDHE